MPEFRYYQLKNESSTTVQATITPNSGDTLRVSGAIAPDKCATVDLAPFSAGSELNSLGLGVASTFGGLSSSAGSFYTFSERVNITLWCTASGDEKGLSIQFNGYGPEDALPKKPEAE